MCTRAAWLCHGELKAVGDASEVVRLYQDDSAIRQFRPDDIQLKGILENIGSKSE